MLDLTVFGQRALKSSLLHVLAALLLAGTAESQNRALVISSSGREAHDLLMTIRAAALSADFRPGSRGLPAPRDMLKEWGVIVVLSNGRLAASESWKLAEYTRLGGGVLLLSEGEWSEYVGSPLENLAPTFFGYEHPTPHPVRVASVAKHPAVAASPWLRSGPVVPRTEIRSPDDPRFARPKTSELERFHKPLLARGWEVLARGEDPAETPLLIAGLYGAGRAAIASFGAAALCALPEAGNATSQLLEWLAGSARPSDRPVRRVAAVGGAAEVLVEGMGFLVFDGIQSSWERFGAVACGSSIDGQVAADVVRYVRDGGTLVILDPGVLLAQLSELGSIGFLREAEGPAGNPVWAMDGTELRVSGDQLLPPWSGLARISGEVVVSDSTASRTSQLRWGRSHTSSTVIGDVGLHSFTVNSHPVRPGQDGVCSLTGLLRPGPNSLELWAWGDGLHGLPVPRFETGVPGRLELSDGWLTRQSFSSPAWTCSTGEPVWLWEDGRPALVRTAWEKGTVWWLTAPITEELVNPRLHRFKEGRPAKRDFFRETTRHLPSMVIHEALYRDELSAQIEWVADSRAVRVRAASPGSHVVWRLYNWQRSLISRGTTENECLLALPQPDDALGYEATSYRDEYWLEIGVLSPAGDELLWWTERHVRPESGTALTVLLPSIAQRSGGPFVTFPRSEELPTEWTTREVAEFPLFLPGEPIDATIVCVSSSDTAGVLTVTARLPLAASARTLVERSLRLRAGVAEVVTAQLSVDEPFAPVLLEAELRWGERRVARAAKPLFVVRPERGLRSVLEVRNKGMQVMGSQYDQSDAEEFARHNLLADPPKGLVWGPYASDYPGQPWCNSHPHPHGIFPNGRYYRDWLRPQIERLAIAYEAGADRAVSASLVDGFNGVPDPEGCFFPQNLYAFTQWMAAAGEPVQATTIGELVETIRWQLFDRWSHFVASELALVNHEVFKEHLTALSPWSDVIDQCDFPLLHQLLGIPKLEELAPRWENIFSVSSTDAWNVQVGRGYHSPTYTQMLAKALAPGLHLGHYHMEMFGGDGVELISLAERMRRQNYDVFWMMALDREGHPRPLQDYFDGGGVSWLGGWRRWLPVCAAGDRGGHVDTDHDWWALMHAYALMEAIDPESPVGACWLAASNRYGTAGYDPGFSMGDGALLFSLLRDNGVPISVSSNVSNAMHATCADGAILVPPAWLDDQGLAGVRELLESSDGLALVQSLGRGTHADCSLDDDLGLGYVGPRDGTYRVKNGDLVGTDQDCTGDASSSYAAAGIDVLVEIPPVKEGRGGDEQSRVVIGRKVSSRGRTAFWSDGTLKGPFAGGREVDHALARLYARAVNWTLDQPIVYEPGTAGYGFLAGGRTFVVLEELTGRGRVTTVGIRDAGGGSCRCVDLNRNVALGCHHDGSYLWIEVPLRPSGATLVAASSSP